MWVFSKLKNQFSIRRKITRLLNESKEYLQSGKYIFQTNTNIVLNKHHIKHDKSLKRIFLDVGLIETNPSKVKKIKTWIKKIINIKAINISSGQNMYQGTLFVLANQGKRVKIFDFQNRVIVNKFSDAIDFNNAINIYNNTKAFFNLPQIINIESEKLIFIEEFIDSLLISELSQKNKEKLIKTILNGSTMLSSHQAAKSSMNINDFVDNLNISDKMIVENFLSKDIMEQNMPISIALGDMMYKNILFCDSKFYFIDFEFEKEYFFFFDIMYFMFSSYLNYDDDYYLKNYLKGQYDSEFELFFKTNKVSFKKELKIEYLNIFIMERNKLVSGTDKKLQENLHKVNLFLKK